MWHLTFGHKSRVTDFTKTVVSSIEIMSKIYEVHFNVLYFILIVPCVLSIPLWEVRLESALRQPSSLLVRPVNNTTNINMTSRR